ncbi:hypothetical protein CRE_24946 [Caenorhabditis remanei]|uniref:Uncharacterized protein n=1 Tax=Caenorhabditis remanei TaxID=31234 RepID=E3MHX5_CAERE|nr:hypothetical protein CRE_24946 [Caenorhabditis remanei]
MVPGPLVHSTFSTDPNMQMRCGCETSWLRNVLANEPLFFDRGNIQHHRPEKLLRGKQLAETLEDARARKMEEKEQLNKHPQDRENKDQEVNEQPDQGEQDYKEH